MQPASAKNIAWLVARDTGAYSNGQQGRTSAYERFSSPHPIKNMILISPLPSQILQNTIKIAIAFTTTHAKELRRMSGSYYAFSPMRGSARQLSNTSTPPLVAAVRIAVLCLQTPITWCGPAPPTRPFLPSSTQLGWTVRRPSSAATT